jgi:hypothetical protein
MMASDANHDLSGDWLEQYLRDEIARRRRERDTRAAGRVA